MIPLNYDVLLWLLCSWETTNGARASANSIIIRHAHIDWSCHIWRPLGRINRLYTFQLSSDLRGLISPARQNLDCIRIWNSVQVKYILFALFITDDLSILETVGAKFYSELRAELAATGASHARSLFHVGAVFTQVEPLSNNVAEFENVTCDLIRADIMLL